MRFGSLLLGASALLTTPVLAQTFTNCNPLNVSLSCPNDPALGLNHTFIFNSSTTVTESYNVTAGSIAYGSNGAEFTVAKRGDSPTIQSKFYIFFGSVSVIMRAATGQGIISSIVLESDDLDEIDWEFMGGNDTFAETNYFGKGNTTSYDRAIYYPVSSDVRENFHNYTVDWTAERLNWMIDGNVVRTLEFADANGGKDYPQTPMTLRLGIWAGGDPSEPNGTIEWAGGLTDFTKAPFTMYVQSAQVNDYSTGAEYEWTDHTGDWQSIKVIAGNSTEQQTLTAVPAATPLSIGQKFSALPQTTKIAVYGGSGAAAVILLASFLVFFMKQRRAGRRERDLYNANVEKEREEAYRDQMELREKGYGGWDNGAYGSQGEDALGGWGGTHVQHGIKAADMPPMPRMPSNAVTAAGGDDFPLRAKSPGLSRVGGPVSAISVGGRGSPAPLVSPTQPTSPRAWNSSNNNGLIHDTHNPRTGGYAGTGRVSRAPSFQRNGGYQRF
ncbi:hypothetical protein G7Y89_g13672 [Cudoniella acicularis]|uniref:chitinase n=1 Tax=Cudoniella acicularis TaxID=354080 RepID=A0A8H4R8U6_9HELO|nr:hypothetical protein G7Y89_g13672 [Cudoniella acicularis]